MVITLNISQVMPQSVDIVNLRINRFEKNTGQILSKISQLMVYTRHGQTAARQTFFAAPETHSR